MFLGGIALLIYSVEKFIENSTKSALVLGVSTFILAGMDFENWAFGIASVVANLPGVAIGSAIGSALFLIGGSIALAGFLTPFEIKVPRVYLILMMVSPLILLGFLFDGALTRIEGAGLLTVFGLVIFYIYKKGRQNTSETTKWKRPQRKQEKESGSIQCSWLLSLSE